MDRGLSRITVCGFGNGPLPSESLLFCVMGAVTMFSWKKYKWNVYVFTKKYFSEIVKIGF